MNKRTHNFSWCRWPIQWWHARTCSSG